MQTPQPDSRGRPAIGAFVLGRLSELPTTFSSADVCALSGANGLQTFQVQTVLARLARQGKLRLVGRGERYPHRCLYAALPLD
jgi:hypothetical protein